MITKEKIGHGSSRDVYAHENPLWCVKVQIGDGKENLREWEIWESFPELHKWLVPCVSISECGKYLVQIRGEKSKKNPRVKFAKMFKHNRKQNSWVIIGGKVKCCDYADQKILDYLKNKGGEKWE